MADLINRHEAIKAINAIDNHDDGMCFEVLSHAVRDVSLLPSVDAIVLDKTICKCSKGDYILYKRKWLYDHLEQEFNILASVSGKAEPIRNGHWILTGRTNVYGGTEIVCSECNDIVMVQHVEDELYCRHCGAKMDEVKEE